MVTDSLIRKKFVHETIKDGMQQLQDAWRPAVSAFQRRTGRLQAFADHPSPTVQITEGRYSVHYFIPLHLRFLDIQYRKNRQGRRKKTGIQGSGQRNLYNKLVWPILYKRVFPELKYGLTDEVRQQLREQLKAALEG